MSRSDVRALLQRHELLARKDLGQNFLVDDALADKLAKLAGVDADECVIEIGTGLGVLTQALARRAERVISLEVDSGLVRVLESERLLPANVELIHADALQTDLQALAQRSGTRVRVVANLPYVISSPLLRRLLDLRAKLSGWAVMLQTEVADRLLASPGTREYSSLGVLHRWCVDVERLHDLHPRCFFPVPKVTSRFLKFTPRSDSPLGDDELARLEPSLRAAFSKRRKTLVNSLRAGGLTPSPAVERVQAILTDLGLDLRVRAEKLDPAQLLALCRALTSEPA